MKKIFISSFLLLVGEFLFTSISSAQNLGVAAYKETTPYSQEFKQIIKTSDGGIIGVSSLGYNGRASKINSSYQQVWSIGIDSIPLSDAIETNDGNYILLGHALTTNYYGAVYIIKVNTSGAILFEKMFYSSINNQLTADGICKAAGNDSGFVFYGGNCIAMHYLIKCDKNGNVQWEKQHAGLGNGAYLSMISESNGYVADFNCSGSTFQSIGISKMDVSGNVTACKIYEGSNAVSVFHNSLAKKASGEYYIWAGPNDTAGTQDYTINSSLTSVSCKRHTMSTQLEITSVLATQNANDEILMTGVLSPGYGVYIKLNSSDNIVYQKQSSTFPSYFNASVNLGGGTYGFGGSASTFGKIIAVVDENSNGVCTTTNLGLNTSNYSVLATTPTITNTVVNALFLTPSLPLYSVTQVKTNLCGALSVENNNAENSEISIYPNPSNENITIETRDKNIKSITIINSLGQVCFQTAEINSTILTIDLSDFKTGIYFLQVNNAEVSSVRKIIKQ